MNLLSHLRDPGSNDTLVVMSTSNTNILISNSILQWKKPGFLGKITDSMTGTEDVPAELGVFYSAIIQRNL